MARRESVVGFRGAARGPLRALIVADGGPDPAALRRAADVPRGVRLLVIGADGGAGRAMRAGITPDLVIGDMDSLPAAARARLEAQGVGFITAKPDKEESDTELCVLEALERGATQIRIVGGLGGDRPEHSVANLLLLAHPALDGMDAAVLAGDATFRRCGRADGPGRLVISGRIGDHVSLFALDARVEGVSTQGLRYPLREEPLLMGPARGLSNELLERQAVVTSTAGRVLVIHTPREASRQRGARR